MPNSLNNWLLCLFLSLLVIFGPVRYMGKWLIGSQQEHIATNLGDGDASQASAKDQKEALPISVLLAQADVKEGQRKARVCQSCHDLASDDANKVGPGLWGVVGRMIAHHPKYSYSSAMKKFSKENKTWTYKHLNAFLENPRKAVRGTKMSFAGIRDPKQRADLIAYLRTLASTPKPLPPIESKTSPQSPDKKVSSKP